MSSKTGTLKVYAFHGTGNDIYFETFDRNDGEESFCISKSHDLHTSAFTLHDIKSLILSEIKDVEIFSEETIFYLDFKMQTLSAFKNDKKLGEISLKGISMEAILTFGEENEL